MARPRRKGLGYFPLDTHFMSDRKIQRLAQRYGCNGICIYIAVLCEAYGENGYYACYDGDFCFDIGFTTGQDEKLVKEIIEFCVQIRLFDSELMEYRQILSSVGIQQRFEEISRRTAMQIDAELNLLAPKMPQTPPVIVTETGGQTAPVGVIATETGFLLRKRPFVQQKPRKIEMEIQIKTQPLKKQDFMDINHQTIMGKQPEGQKSSSWLKRQQEVANMRGRYGSAEQFLKLFTPDLQIATARNEVRAYLGSAPSLAVLAEGYGWQTVIVWLCIMIENLNNFTGVREKMPVARQRDLATLILAEYPSLKASEILLFFHRLKCGRYGRFYGMVDALFITSSLLQFSEQRRTDIIRYKEEQSRAEKSALPPPDTGNYITREEYLEQKRLKENKNG